MEEALVSAVILTYNQQNYIAQAIECALAQRVDFDYEIVVGEDCSTDETRRICLDYQERYPDLVRVLTSDHNVGLLENWQRSVESARGHYIAGCGGDDFWHNPDKLRKQVAFLQQNPEYGMVHSAVDCLIERSGAVVPSRVASKDFPVHGGRELLVSLFDGSYYPIIACSVMFRKRFFNEFFDIGVLKRNGFLMEDTPLWAEIIANSKVFYMRESLATYRSRTDDGIRRVRFAVSNAAFCLYACRKYNLPLYVQKFHEQCWRRSALHLAFRDRSPEAARAVRNQWPRLSVKERVWYLGTVVPLLRPFVWLLSLLFRRSHTPPYLSRDCEPKTSEPGVLPAEADQRLT